MRNGHQRGDGFVAGVLKFSSSRMEWAQPGTWSSRMRNAEGARSELEAHPEYAAPLYNLA